MKYTRIDITGQRFNRYLVLGFSYIKNGRAYWKCQCDCGIIKDIRGTSLRNGNTQSCGCFCREKSSEVNSGARSHMFGKKRPDHSIKMRGKNHPRYNFNLTDAERSQHRRYFEYDIWRTSVFERDTYTCQCCGTKKSPFNAHHLESYDSFIDLRTLLSNGITLCVGCHKKFHKQYGRGHNTNIQFKEFINNQ